MKDELGGIITTEFVALRPKTYSYLIDGNNENKKGKGKRKLKFEDYKHCLQETQLENKIDQLEKINLM